MEERESVREIFRPIIKCRTWYAASTEITREYKSKYTNILTNIISISNQNTNVNLSSLFLNNNCENM